jgi:hypothetical protein
MPGSRLPGHLRQHGGNIIRRGVPERLAILGLFVFLWFSCPVFSDFPLQRELQ